MFTSKQRAHLKSLASTMKPIMQVGKEGIGENLVNSLSEALEARELIKITLLPAAGEDGENLAANLADLLRAEVVAVIGRKAILYRKSSRKNFEHIVF
ncbi:MAG: YhbY family RNA-binding protein [Clostridia bacterium]|nr:YhbY family RNA-binding protein [Clostridia bacterium]